MIKELDDKFKKSHLPTTYSLALCEEILITNYRAVEIDMKFFEDLKNDNTVKYENIVKYFKITDIEFLSTLFNEFEKETHSEIAEFNSTFPFVYPEGAPTETNIIWREIQEGKRIHILMESVDQKNISSFTMQGVCEKILQELIVLRGIRPEDCVLGNPDYENYLTALHQVGKI